VAPGLRFFSKLSVFLTAILVFNQSPGWFFISERGGHPSAALSLLSNLLTYLITIIETMHLTTSVFLTLVATHNILIIELVFYNFLNEARLHWHGLPWKCAQQQQWQCHSNRANLICAAALKVAKQVTAAGIFAITSPVGKKRLNDALYWSGLNRWWLLTCVHHPRPQWRSRLGRGSARPPPSDRSPHRIR